MKVWFDANLSNQKNFFLDVLNDPRAWNRPWTRALTKKEANWIVYLKSSNFIDSKTCTSQSCFKGLSVTLMDENPRITYFNETNWNNVPMPLQGLYTLEDYRTYVILHECGHAVFSLDHPHKIKPGLCPIMVQQTKGLPIGTLKNIWPLELEKKKALKNV
jgi:hypothetical protein